MTSPLGRPMPHESALRHVSGEARYVDDLPEPAGMLHGMALASPHAHARIVARDAKAALEVPGVHAVLFAGDLPAENQMGPVVHDEPLLATDAVHCVGQLVAVVYAESREACRAALARIHVAYEPLPALLDLHEAIAAGSFLGETHVIARGDADAAIASAPHRLAGATDSGGQDHFYLETHCALAVPEEDRAIRVYSSTQHPSEVQAAVAHTLGWGRHRVVVECPRMGGGFGGKETQGSHFASLAALGAWRTGRACKVWLDRDQDMTTTGRRHPFHARWEVGFDERGRISGFAVDLYANAGWATDLSHSILDRGLFHLDNAYWLPAVRLTGRTVRTNHVSNTAFRGFGGPQGMVVVEHVMERIAAALGLDPLAVRRANLYGDAPENLTPYGAEVADFRVPRMLDEVEASAEYAARGAEIAAFNERSAWIKRGLSITPVKFGISFTASFLNQAGAYVVLYSDGTVQLNHGGTEMGQGLYTKMLQIAAHALGVPLTAIRHMATSTEKVPNTSATAASSGADLNGQAVRLACEALVDRLRPVAADLLGVPPAEVQLRAGGGEGPGWAWSVGRSATFAQVVAKAYLAQIPLSAGGYYRTPDIGYDRKVGKGRPFFYYAYGVACSEVELNGLTGEWRLRRVDVVHDVGDSLSPDIDRGQVEGAFLQGLGWLGSEELRWNAQGALITHSPSTYKIPAIGEAPLDFRVRLLERAPQPGVVYGSKAVGEPPFMLAISAHAALSRAASALAGVDVVLPMPATAEAVLLAVEDALRPARVGAVAGAEATLGK